jgi:hypothetical protein
MDVNFKYVCVGTNNKDKVQLLLDKDNNHITIPADGICSVDSAHDKFLKLIGFDPKFLKPVLLDVIIEKDQFNIYYGVLFPLELDIKTEWHTLKDAKPLNLNNSQLELLYKTMAKGMMP